MANPFKGMGGMPDVNKLMAKVREDGEKMQAKLDEARLDGSSGGGMVKVTADGHGHLLELTISPEVVDPNDVGMLQDLVMTAMREALEKSETMREAEAQKMIPPGIPGLNIPGLF